MTSPPVWLRRACAVGLALVAVTAAGCGGSGQSTAGAQGGCVNGWNGMANARTRERFAGAYMYAKVVTTSKDGDACVFALHGDDPPVLMLAGRWDGSRLLVSRWTGGRAVAAPLPHGTPPSNVDNAIISGTGRLFSGVFPPETHVAAAAHTPKWLLLRARREATLYHDPSPTAVVIRPDGDLWRLTLRGHFICESCFMPVGPPKPKAVVVEDFNPRTKAGQGISYG